MPPRRRRPADHASTSSSSSSTWDWPSWPSRGPRTRGCCRTSTRMCRGPSVEPARSPARRRAISGRLPIHVNEQNVGAAADGDAREYAAARKLRDALHRQIPRRIRHERVDADAARLRQRARLLPLRAPPHLALLPPQRRVPAALRDPRRQPASNATSERRSRRASSSTTSSGVGDAPRRARSAPRIRRRRAARFRPPLRRARARHRPAAPRGASPLPLPNDCSLLPSTRRARARRTRDGSASCARDTRRCWWVSTTPSASWSRRCASGECWHRRCSSSCPTMAASRRAAARQTTRFAAASTARGRAASAPSPRSAAASSPPPHEPVHISDLVGDLCSARRRGSRRCTAWRAKARLDRRVGRDDARRWRWRTAARAVLLCAFWARRRRAQAARRPAVRRAERVVGRRRRAGADEPKGACVECGDGCVFDVAADPSERLARSKPSLLSELRAASPRRTPRTGAIRRRSTRSSSATPSEGPTVTTASSPCVTAPRSSRSSPLRRRARSPPTPTRSASAARAAAAQREAATEVHACVLAVRQRARPDHGAREPRAVRELRGAPAGGGRGWVPCRWSERTLSCEKGPPRECG